MDKAKNTKATLPRTQLDLVTEAVNNRNAVGKSLTEAKASLRALMEKEFAAKGGCEKCGGRGWVVVWDTMDSMTGCYAEYGSCPDPACTEATRKASGLKPYHSKYDGLRGVADPITTHPAYSTLILPLQKLYDELDRKFRDVEYQHRSPFAKGDRVVVARGRKLPIGTVGRIAYISANGGYLIKPDDDQWNVRMSPAIGWANSNNLERLV